jgi:hypothetical protein
VLQKHIKDDICLVLDYGDLPSARKDPMLLTVEMTDRRRDDRQEKR